MSQFRNPQFLTDRDEPSDRVRCAIHGFIRFSENEREIINHLLFRRLRYIKQLALTDYLYPGATHSRFEHSLGVMDVATRAFDHLARRYGALMENVFGEVEGFKAETLAKARQYVRLAALLHDVGHASFSHVAEGVVHKDMKHEALSVRIVSRQEYLGELITNKFGAECPIIIAQIIEGGEDLAPQLHILHDLVSGEVDADRTDYLIRDSHHCGVDYGRFDYRRMIECLELVEGDFSSLDIGVSVDGMHTIEALIQARYQMNTQVYYHRVRRIYDLYLVKYHEALHQHEPFTETSILKANDVVMMMKISQDAQRKDDPRGKWAERIYNRHHHRQIFDTGVNANIEDVRRIDKVLEGLKYKYDTVEFLDDKSEIRIHKLVIPSDKSDKGLKRLQIVGLGKRNKQIGFVSQILGSIPRESLCGRIYADVGREDRQLRNEIEIYAQQLWTESGGN